MRFIGIGFYRTYNGLYFQYHLELCNAVLATTLCCN